MITVICWWLWRDGESFSLMSSSYQWVTPAQAHVCNINWYSVSEKNYSTMRTRVGGRMFERSWKEEVGVNEGEIWSTYTAYMHEIVKEYMKIFCVFYTIYNTYDIYCIILPIQMLNEITEVNFLLNNLLSTATIDTREILVLFIWINYIQFTMWCE